MAIQDILASPTLEKIKTAEAIGLALQEAYWRREWEFWCGLRDDLLACVKKWQSQPDQPRLWISDIGRFDGQGYDDNAALDSLRKIIKFDHGLTFWKQLEDGLFVRVEVGTGMDTGIWLQVYLSKKTDNGESFIGIGKEGIGGREKRATGWRGSLFEWIRRSEDNKTWLFDKEQFESVHREVFVTICSFLEKIDDNEIVKKYRQNPTYVGKA